MRTAADPLALPAAAPGSARGHAGRRARRPWADVRIEELAIGPVPDSGERQTYVRACVRLGTLLPADVVVELISSRPGAVPAFQRMFSELPYSDGPYLFETRLGTSELGASTAHTVRVSPAPGSPVEEEAPVTRQLLPALALTGVHEAVRR